MKTTDSLLRRCRKRGAIPVILTALLGGLLTVAGHPAPPGKTAATTSPAPTVRDLKTLTTSLAAGLYTPNRAPLQPAFLMKLPIGSIQPRGWLREQLVLDANGLSGHIDEISEYLQYEKNGWVDPKSDDGWEELPYWLRGYGDLGYVLGDARINQVSKRWIEGILADQRPDGWFGPDRLRTSLDGGPDMWPHMLILYALQSAYERRPDSRILTFLARYFAFQQQVPGAQFGKGWARVRWADNLQAIYWLYNRTGDPSLLTLARRIHENSANYVDHLPTLHNVNLAQGIREPVEFWLQAKQDPLLKATENDYESVMRQYGQFPGGGFAGDENARPGYHDPRQGFETCGMVEFMNTFEILTRIAGDPVWADRCEDVAFNSLPAALTPDHKGIHYITSANSVSIEDDSKRHAQFDNGTFPMQGFMPGIHNYRCCPHNYPMGWPYYAENLTLATADNGLCASLYAASDVMARVGAAATSVTLRETSDYPFRDTVEFTVTAAGQKATTFPLYLRIPGWAEGATVAVNGVPARAQSPLVPDSYARVERAWRVGDKVTLRLPMRIRVDTWAQNGDSVSVDRGPLSYSLLIGEKTVRHDQSDSKGTGVSDAWPETDVLPTTPWNYGLVLDPAHPAASLAVEQTPGPIAGQPFTPETAPIKLVAWARRIPDWKADTDDVVTPLQASPVRSTEPTVKVTLIPMGATLLRITAFPTIGSGPNAHDWQLPALPAVRVSASHANDDTEAPMVRSDPTSSNDHATPRFTWWDHKGTTEWLQYDFKTPRTLSGVQVYWFDDTGVGACRVPASWRILYREGGVWKPVVSQGNYGVARDQYNKVTFAPVTATAFRVEAQLQPGFSGGVLRWYWEPTKP